MEAAIKLPNFLKFVPFNQLRQQMEAASLGHFVPFNGAVHLSAMEREALAKTGLEIDSQQLRILSDKTLAFKNSRVVAWLPISSPESIYHVANCSAVQHWLERPIGGLQVSTAFSPLRTTDSQVCEDCLQQLNFRGFNRQRNRHRAYNRQLQRSFQLKAFFEHYPLYPIEESEAIAF